MPLDKTENMYKDKHMATIDHFVDCILDFDM